MNRKKLIEALRSDEYQQGQGALYTNGLFCCLGVACEVYQKEVGDLVIVDLEGELVGTRRYDDQRYMLPEKVREWLGFKTAAGACNNGWALSLLNDHGKTFQEIADFIESEPDGLFQDSGTV